MTGLQWVCVWDDENHPPSTDERIHISTSDILRKHNPYGVFRSLGHIETDEKECPQEA